jgi:hypothetical protein
MLFKEVGMTVKQGEVVASEELHNGHFINNYRAICDGTVTELHGPIVVIKAAAPNLPIHPYSPQIIEIERHRRSLIQEVREKERALIDQGIDSIALRRQGIRDRGVDGAFDETQALQRPTPKPDPEERKQ